MTFSHSSFLSTQSKVFLFWPDCGYFLLFLVLPICCVHCLNKGWQSFINFQLDCRIKRMKIYIFSDPQFSFCKNFFFQFQELGLEMKVCSFVFCLIFCDLIRLGLEKSLFLEIIVFTLMYLYLIYGSRLIWYLL